MTNKDEIEIIISDKRDNIGILFDANGIFFTK